MIPTGTPARTAHSAPLRGLANCTEGLEKLTPPKFMARPRPSEFRLAHRRAGPLTLALPDGHIKQIRDDQSRHAEEPDGVFQLHRGPASRGGPARLSGRARAPSGSSEPACRTGSGWW